MIEITKNYDWLNDEYKYQGKYYLDIDPSSIRINDRIGQSLLNSIDVPSALGISLKMTPRNISALEPFIHGQSSKYSGTPCNVLAYLGDQPLPLTHLYVIGSDDSAGVYSCELRHPDNYWLELADKLKIKDITLPKIQFSKHTIISDNYLNEYSVGQSPYRYPHVNWGQLNASSPIDNSTLRTNNILYYEMRPFICLTYLLKEGAKLCGINLKAPVFETYWGNRLITYLLRDDYGKNDANNKRRSLEVFTGQQITFGNNTEHINFIMPFDHIIFDGGNNWVNKQPASIYLEPTFYYYRGPGFIGELYAKCTVYLSWSKGKNNVKFDATLSIWIDTPALSNNPVKLGENKPLAEITDYTFGSAVFEIRLSDQNIPPESKLYVRFEFSQNKIDSVIVDLGAVFKITPERSIYSEGDTINLSDELDQDMTYLELLKGASHLINGKIYQRMNSATVWLLPTYPTKVYETENLVEGFFKDSFVNITNQIVPNSLKRKSGNAFSDKNIRVGFQQSNDPYIEFDGENNIQIFDSVYFEPRRRKSLEIVSRNPVFVPTINKSVTFINNPNETDMLLRRAANDLPFITDNKDGKISYSVGKRILYYHGTTPVRRKDENGNLIIPGLLYDDVDALTAYAFDNANLVHLDGSYFKENIVYGDKVSPFTDLFQQFWKQSIIEIDNGTLHDLLVFGGGKLNFRDIIYLEYMGHGYAMRLQEITDWDGGISGLSTPLTLIPTKGNLNIASISDPGLEIRSDCDSSGIVLNYTESGGCYSAEIGGSSPIPILSTTFSHKYENDIDWINGNTLCNPSGTFIFRMVIEFDEDCDPVTLTKTVVPCDNSPVVKFTYDPISKCLTIECDNTDVHSDISSTEIYYNRDGGDPILYVSPICDLEGIETINVIITQQYSSGCADSEIEGSITFPVSEYDCSLNDPQLSYSTLADCKIKPYRTGTIIEEIVLIDTILYRYESTEWQIWDENTPIDIPVALKRVVMFEYCSPVVIELEVI